MLSVIMNNCESVDYSLFDLLLDALERLLDFPTFYQYRKAVRLVQACVVRGKMSARCVDLLGSNSRHFNTYQYQCATDTLYIVEH